MKEFLESTFMKFLTVVTGVFLLAWNLPYTSGWLSEFVGFTPTSQMTFWIVVIWFILGHETIVDLITDVENADWYIAFAAAALAAWGFFTSADVLGDVFVYLYTYALVPFGLGLLGLIVAFLIFRNKR